MGTVRTACVRTRRSEVLASNLPQKDYAEIIPCAMVKSTDPSAKVGWLRARQSEGADTLWVRWSLTESAPTASRDATTCQDADRPQLDAAVGPLKTSFDTSEGPENHRLGIGVPEIVCFFFFFFFFFFLGGG